MPVVIGVEPNTRLYGDHPGTLSGHAEAGSQDLGELAVLTAIGDADVLTGHAVGGNDTVGGFDPTHRHSGGLLLGDAFTIAGHAAGGDDVLLANTVEGVTIYGD